MLLGGAMLLVTLVLQFVPFWSGGGQSASIAQFVWFPKDYPDLTAWLGSTVEGFDMNDMVLAPVLQLVCAVVGLALCIAEANSLLPYIPMGISGVAVLFGCLDPVFRLGGLWPLHMILSFLLVVVSIMGIGVWIREHKNAPHVVMV